MTKTLNMKIEKRPAAWTFVSGKIAALESELLPRSFFETILKSADRSEARIALGKSVYRTLFPDDRSLSDVSAIMDAKAKEARADIFKLCPPHPLENFFGIGARFRSFRTLFNSLSKQSNPPLGELDALFPVFAVEPAYADQMIEHRQMVTRKNSPQAATPMERSLYLDSAACTLMLVVSGSAPEELVRRYMRDRAILTAWSGIFRARWNGVGADMIKNWFILGDSNEFASAVLAQENDPKAVVMGRLSMQSSTTLEAVDHNRVKADIDSVSADVLRDTVLSCRRVPFGAERVLSYLVANEVEMVNLELCLSSVANGIDRATTASRLRREYA